MSEIVTYTLAFIAMLSAVVLYLWHTPAQHQPVTKRQPARVNKRRDHREV
jgi:hypothetical protein